MCYPVEGESAFAELLYDGAQWAEVHLEDVEPARVGEQRTENARVVVVLYPRTARWRGGGIHVHREDPAAQGVFEEVLRAHPRYRWRWMFDALEAVASRFSPAEPIHFDYAESEAALEQAFRRRGRWGFGVADALAELARARAALLENEHDREPLDDEGGLTAVGSAFSKMSRREQARFLADVEETEAAVEEPAHVENGDEPSPH